MLTKEGHFCPKKMHVKCMYKPRLLAWVTEVGSVMVIKHQASLPATEI